MHPGSPPCLAILLASNSIGVTLNSKFVDLLANEHLKDDFLKVSSYNMCFDRIYISKCKLESVGVSTGFFEFLILVVNENFRVEADFFYDRNY